MATAACLPMTAAAYHDVRPCARCDRRERVTTHATKPRRFPGARHGVNGPICKPCYRFLAGYTAADPLHRLRRQNGSVLAHLAHEGPLATDDGEPICPVCRDVIPPPTRILQQKRGIAGRRFGIHADICEPCYRNLANAERRKENRPATPRIVGPPPTPAEREAAALAIRSTWGPPTASTSPRERILRDPSLRPRIEAALAIRDYRRAWARLMARDWRTGPVRVPDRTPAPDGPTTTYRGVRWLKRLGQWEASVQWFGQRRVIGTFDEADDAARAHDAEVRRLGPLPVPRGRGRRPKPMMFNFPRDGELGYTTNQRAVSV